MLTSQLNRILNHKIN